MSRLDEAAAIEVWTEARDDGRVDWRIRVDGVDHGGGTVDAHWEGHQAAAGYLNDDASDAAVAHVKADKP